MKRFLQITIIFSVLGIGLIGCGKDSGGRSPPNDLRDYKKSKPSPTRSSASLSVAQLREKVMHRNAFPGLRLEAGVELEHRTIENRLTNERRTKKLLGFLNVQYTTTQNDWDDEVVTRRYHGTLGILGSGNTLGETSLEAGLSGEAYRNKIRNYLRNQVLSGQNLVATRKAQTIGGKTIQVWKVVHGDAAQYFFSFNLPLEFNPTFEEVREGEVQQNSVQWINKKTRVVIPRNFFSQ